MSLYDDILSGKEKLSLSISIIRGFLLNIVLVLLIPFIFGGESLWIVVPITEIITFIGICMYLFNVTTKKENIQSKLVS